MSLEAAVQANTEQLTKMNALLAQLLTEQTSVINLESINVTTPAETQEEKAKPEAKPKKQAAKKAEATPVNLDDLQLDIVVALAVQYHHAEGIDEFTTEHVSTAETMLKDKESNALTEKTDALYMAVCGVAGIKDYSNTDIFSVCTDMLDVWGEMPNLVSRRSYAKGQLIRLTTLPVEDTTESAPEDTPTPDGSGAETVDYAALRSEATRLINQMVKGGYRTEAVELLAKFNAKKLPEVDDESLSDLINQANAAMDDSLTGE